MGVLDEEYTPTPTRMSNEQPSTYNIDDAAAEIQRGNIQKPQAFADQSRSAGHGLFKAGVGVASLIAQGASSFGQITIPQRNEKTGYYLTEAENQELLRMSASIAAHSNIPDDVITEFLRILCFVDKIEDMTTIANGVQLAELADPTIIRQPFAILAVPNLHKIAYMASAVEGLVHLFRKYIQSSQAASSNKGEGVESMISTMTSMLSGFGGGGIGARLDNSGSEDAVGHFLSELISGKRIPTSVIAKNPNLQMPSFIGKAMFGESPTALSVVDLKEVFNKKIGCFPKPSNGSGTTSFSLQNIGSMGNITSITGAVGKLVFGNSTIPIPGSKRALQLAPMLEKVTTLVGANIDDSIDLRRADNAIPLLTAISAVQSDTDKSLFSIDTFREGWTLSNSVSNTMNNNKVVQAMRTML